jgi:hypothetical protein
MVPEGSLPCSQEPSAVPWAKSIHFTSPYPISLRFILILSSHLRLGLSTELYPSGFSTKILHPLRPMRAICPVHLILFGFIFLIILGEEYILWMSLLCKFLQPPVTSSLFGPNILLSTLFSNTLSSQHIIPLNNYIRLGWNENISYSILSSLKLIMLMWHDAWRPE